MWRAGAADVNGFVGQWRDGQTQQEAEHAIQQAYPRALRYWSWEIPVRTRKGDGGLVRTGARGSVGPVDHLEGGGVEKVYHVFSTVLEESSSGKVKKVPSSRTGGAGPSRGGEGKVPPVVKRKP